MSNFSHSPLDSAMRLAVLAGGKRFRPVLVNMSCALFDISGEAIQRIAISVEFLHAASLVLDDLPVMDNAETRRGTPSVHRVFGEAQAILTATALISLAFKNLAEPETWKDPEIRSKLVVSLANAIGPAGISGGQSIDLQGVSGAPHKTADLIRFCCETGPLLADAPPSLQSHMSQFGTAMGLAFQQRDDLLDGHYHPDQALHGSHPQHPPGVKALELAKSLISDYGFSREKVSPLIEISHWVLDPFKNQDQFELPRVAHFI